MHSNDIANNYDCTPLLPSNKNTKSGIDQITPPNNRNWLRRLFNATPLLEKTLSAIRSSGQSGNNSNCQWKNSCGQQYGANGGYACDKVCSTVKMDISEHSTKVIRIYWRVM
ncbi:unnamed protein product [Cercopithifilaria johnstoni]|uniref:Uncharacterized protein n=1 Tax=Cercopithifilaria johnstoni TaxID=2874296 RepID=A0A8J2Q8V8_9BILA|nr:unnamed protein product [Cercopithifilaria johnstoni]